MGDSIVDSILGTIGIGAQTYSAHELNETNKEIAAAANAAAAKNAHDQMAFQERMSNSAYQRSRADMEAAGLNPMMMMSQGGASSPAGASAPVIAPQMQEVLGKGVTSAMDQIRLKRELSQTDSQTKLNAAMEKTQAAQAKLNDNSAKVAENTAKAQAHQMPAVKAQAVLDEKKAKIDSALAVPDAFGTRLKGALQILK